MQYRISRLAKVTSSEDVIHLNTFLSLYINQLWNNLAVDFTYESGSPGKEILLRLVKKVGKELNNLSNQLKKGRDYGIVLRRLSNIYAVSLSDIRKKEREIASVHKTIGAVRDWDDVPPRLRAFCHVLQEGGVITQSEYTLAGGFPSNYFFDVDKMLSKPEYVEDAADYFAKEIQEVRCKNRITKLAFIEKEVGTVGMLPLMSLIIFMTRIDGFVVRLGKQVSIGKIKSSFGCEPANGDVVAIISDVATAGEGILAAAETIREKGASAPFAFVLYDRDQGARERLQKNGISLRTVVTHKELNDLGLVPSEKGPIFRNEIPIPPDKIKRLSTGMDQDALAAEEKIVISSEK